MLDAHTRALRLLALQELMHAVHGGRVDELIAGGLRPEVLDRLRQTTFQDAVALAAREDLRVRVNVDGESLERSLRRLDMQRANEQQREYFIRHAATPALIQKLFKLDRAAMDKLRKLLRDSPRGRPPLPAVSERDAIQCAWRELTASEPDPRSRYVRLHQSFSQYPIRVLEAVLKEFEE